MQHKNEKKIHSTLLSKKLSRNRYERREYDDLTTTDDSVDDDELKNIKDRFHSHDQKPNYRKVLMYGSCNESESEEDNVYRQNVASDDRKKELKSLKTFSLSLSLYISLHLSIAWMTNISFISS
jgi:hypothetical protein